MHKLLIIILALFSLNTYAQGRECRAILLGDGIESPNCLGADERFENMTDAEFNSLVCNQNVREFEYLDTRFSRARDSGNLISSECEWEVRANSGSH